MIIRCPACGAEMGLDTVIDHDAAATALAMALGMTPLGKLLVRYLALFRPATRRLSWPRVATLLNELLPMIEAGRIERDSKVYEAPNHVWCSAIEKTLLARDTGNLKTPLKTHGYLFEIIITEGARSEARGLVVAGDEPRNVIKADKPMSSTAQAIAKLEQRKRG